MKLNPFFIVNTVETYISVLHFSLMTTENSVSNISLFLYTVVGGRVSASYREKCWQCRTNTEMVKWNWYGTK